MLLMLVAGVGDNGWVGSGDGSGTGSGSDNLYAYYHFLTGLKSETAGLQSEKEVNSLMFCNSV